ncbi:hypothetical protein Q0F98_26295 [Paenibacillus amylolyticus]|nr:hypothetical protein Q0F98_26295 [Paenibacillus amylolyticus]
MENKKIKKKISFIETISLLMVIVSLLVAINSLVVSKKVYLLASKDYIPNIDFRINDKSITVTNKTNDIFSISEINYIDIEKGGYEEFNTGNYVQIPLIRESISNYINVDEGKREEYIVDFDEPHPAADILPLSEEIINKTYEKLERDYSLENREASALPYLFEGSKIIEIVYDDAFHNSKRIIYKYYHIHGIGDFRKEVISDEQKKQILDEAMMPEFDDFNKFWAYATQKYKKKFE